MFRLTKAEEKELNDKCVDFNKVLINKNLVPLKASELLHVILKTAIKNTKISKNGEIYSE